MNLNNLTIVHDNTNEDNPLSKLLVEQKLPISTHFTHILTNIAKASQNSHI
jgi:hypothetical protein